MNTDGDQASATTWATGDRAPVAGTLVPLDIVPCPQCGLPAEIADRAVAASTAGPVDLVRIMCIHRHWFMLTGDRAAGRAAA